MGLPLSLHFSQPQPLVLSRSLNHPGEFAGPFGDDKERMTVSTNPDGAEDINDFLLRIRELGERRDKEDEERTKKLEEEILQGRKERQARRAGITFVPSLLCREFSRWVARPSAGPKMTPRDSRALEKSPIHMLERVADDGS